MRNSAIRTWYSCHLVLHLEMGHQLQLVLRHHPLVVVTELQEPHHCYLQLCLLYSDSLLFLHFSQRAMPPSPWLLHQPQSYCVVLN
uniref:Uncharacterized protein n=1 Tax=Arundo donax TaxID=35708 RepID=A0A0A9EXU8_ARUDO